LILRVERGGNYGWSLYEGPQKIRNDIPLGPTPIRKPLLAYPHTDGQSVTGGVVYRGQRFPELQGTYLYGDYVNGKLWGLRYEGDQVVWHALLADTGLPIISFHEDGEGEVIVVGFDGSLHRLMDNPELDSSREFPRVLSKTGIFRDLRKLEGEAGVAPYRLLATAYEGGATSTYHVAIPGSSQVELRQAKKQWVYPSGTVFAKTLSWPRLDGELPLHLETQLLRYNGKTWDPFSYAWREDQSDADLVGPEGGSVEWIAALVGKDRREYRIRSRAECRSCHHLQAGAIAGWDFANLGQASSSVGRSQLEELRAAGLIRGEVKAAWTPRAMVDPRDASANLTDRARSYLAIHCSQCHCRGGGGTVALELPYTHTLEQTNALQAIPTQGTFGLDDPQVIFPGDPYRSVLYYRLATCGSGHMPKLWDRDNDLEGIRLIHDWICSLADAGLSTPPAKRSAMPRRPGRDESSTRLEVAISSGDLGDDPTAVATTTAALRWLHAASAGQVSDQQRTVMLALAREHADPLIRGLWERLLPIGERTERLGNQISSETILSMQGDAAAGRQRFLASKSQQCRQCHRAEGQGRAVGPDLDGIGSKRSPAELLESVIDPSRRIEPAYASHQVLTVDGRVFTGILGESPSGEVRLRLADGSEQRLELDEIEERREGGLSLMPHGLAAEMTAEELADLIAYLASLTVIDSAGR
jgi:putative heme-binding domain-containing protein